MKQMPVTIYLDADACPVKEHVYRVGARYGVPVRVVSNAPLRLPPQPDLELIRVTGAFDAADDWIAEHTGDGDVVLTADIPLAARVLRAGADCLDFRGDAFDSNRIGDALASRDINAYLRSMGLPTTGPKPYTDRDKSRFASRLDALVSKRAKSR
jgi:uncharacterized protein YaiI (UPF0178 family)